jgi:hypothetical protein
MLHAHLHRGFMNTMLVLSVVLIAWPDSKALSAPNESEAVVFAAPTGAIDLSKKWKRHAIAAGSNVLKGADGVHLADINGDGRIAVVSGHEQGNKISVSLHPGFGPQVGSPWPTVVLPAGGTIVGPEDAVFGDVDADGHQDIIVGAEGGQRVVVLFAPSKPEDLMKPGKWTRMDLQSNPAMRSMRVALANVAGAEPWPKEIVVGGKKSDHKGATIGYFRLTTPAEPRVAESWTYTPIRPVGWVMQMLVRDVDEDGHLDIVYTDREKINTPANDNSAVGLRWLQSSGGDSPTWIDHPISPSVHPEAEHKWFDLAKWNQDDALDIADCRSGLASALNQMSLWVDGGNWVTWKRVHIDEQANVGQCQHITFVDIDQDGVLDLGITHSHAGVKKSGVIWLRRTGGSEDSPTWDRGEISGNDAGDGMKFDNLIWYDVDGDGDLDAVTSEQHEPAGNGPGLGVVWYENPLKP